MTERAMSPRAIGAWCSYDWGMTAGHAVIDTFIFSVYFSRSVAASVTEGTAAWGNALAAAGFVIAVLSPVLGAIADRTGRRKPWIAAFTLIAIGAMIVLYGVTPEPASVPLALAAFTVMVVARELALVFYNAMLPTLAPPGHLGRLSGWGYAAGYAGGLACLVLALYGLVKADAPLFGLIGTGAEQNVRAVAPLSGLWLAVFALPLFFWTPDQPASGQSLGRAAREGMATLGQTLRDVQKYRTIAWFLVASAFYRDGLATLTAFGGLYAAGSFGMSFSEILIFAMMLNVTAGLGATGFAWIDDWIGARATILVTLVGLLIFAGGILLVHEKSWFWGLSLGLGVFIGPSQAAGRSMLARLAPQGMVSEMFGLYGFTGKAAAFLGPLALGWATLAFESQRAGMATILVFFLIGLVMMLNVREPRS